MTSPQADTARFGPVDLLHAAAVDDHDGWVTLFAVNRSTDSGLSLTVDLGDFLATGPAQHSYMTDSDPLAANTVDAPDRVTPTAGQQTQIHGRQLLVDLPAMSWNMVRIPIA
jgi:alpha-L-arabinofuranosidase